MASEPTLETPRLHRVRSTIPPHGSRPELTRSPNDVQRLSGRGPPSSAHSRQQRFISLGIRSIFLPSASCHGPSIAGDRGPNAITSTPRPRSSPASSRPRSRPRPPPLRLAIPSSSSEESIVVLPPVPAPPSAAASGQPASSQSSSANVPNFSRQSLFHITKKRGRALPGPQLDVLNPVNTTPRNYTFSSTSDDLPVPATSTTPHCWRSGLLEESRPPNFPPDIWARCVEAKRRAAQHHEPNPFNLPIIPQPFFQYDFNMATSPHTQTSPVAAFPASPTNHTPKDLPGSKPPSTSSSAHRQPDPNPDSDNRPQVPPSPSDHSLPWTPAHPCYPHLNPHVPRQDPRASSSRVIRVQRDWSNAGDLYPQFSDTYPEILAPWITEREFRSLISNVNDASRAAFEPATGRAWLDAVMGLVTGWLWEDFGFAVGSTGAKKCERVISAWNAECRRRRAAERGTPAVAVEKDTRTTEVDLVECVPLQRTAWMSLDFVIPDPKISVVPEKPAEPPANTSRVTPRGSGERLGERERREASRKSSRKSSRKVSAEKFSQGGPSGSAAVAEKSPTTGAEGWTRDVEKGREVGVAM